MPDPLSRLRRFLAELKRRKVYRVAVAYLVVGFAVLEGADIVFPRLGLPPWSVTLVIALAGVGFPLALVLAWAFDLTPGGVERTPAEVGPAKDLSPAEERSRVGRLAAQGLVAIGLLAGATAGGWYLLGSGGASPTIQEKTVAVLPFQVSGPGTGTWREGMVTVLGTGVDGAAGLRAVADQTVLAAWEEVGPDGEASDTPRFLQAARQVRAEYAVVGSAVKLGGELRLSANVHDTRSGDRLDRVEVRGAPDSVTVLADSVARRVLGVILEKGGDDLPSVDLARVTTRSPEALEAYLEAEGHFRDGDLEAAFADYRAAIRADSTFALAYNRLLHTSGWAGIGAGFDVMERAFALEDQLPLRERRLLRAMRVWVSKGRSLPAADTLRALTEAYPDDPNVWYNLGEVLWHGVIPGSWIGSEPAFARAVGLDPEVAPYHHHLVDLAFSLHRDSARAAKRIEAHPGREDRKRLFRLAHDMVFGVPERRDRALALIQDVPVPNDWALWFMLRHPVDGELEDRVLRILLDREDLDDLGHAAQALILNDLEQGRIERATSDLQYVELDPTLAACHLAGAEALGLPVPESVASTYLEPSNMELGTSMRGLKCAGMHLIHQERADELPSLFARIRERARGPGSRDGLEQTRPPKDVVDLLRGYRAWKAGDLETARRLLTDRDPWEWWDGSPAVWRGDFYREIDRLDTAERWYQAAWWHPLAHERLGRLYEEMNRPDEASKAYQRFIQAWRYADESLQDHVERARRRLQALNGGVADD